MAYWRGFGKFGAGVGDDAGMTWSEHTRFVQTIMLLSELDNIPVNMVNVPEEH
ncbi:hypothetical protein [Actinotignum urinale]|uniref:Uncharacterized protein n=1 Tax=Actinotignum urinale TaxID=190146 RepID=A0AAW9HK83_9ACTO|nr:hypothetical protein [Actinotignum urinale]MDY5154338.1 hypothetical protein [Actinotignum urinale]